MPELQKSVSCIGYFDGMHRGHQKLIRTAVTKAKEKVLTASLICFSPDPDEVISSKRAVHLFSDEERYRIAASFGIRQILIIHFDQEFMDLSPLSFIKEYLEKMNIEELICGFDFSFGKFGKGDPSFLKENGSFAVQVIEEERYEGSKISSSRIKECLLKGDFSLAEKLLGFPYYFTLEVIKSIQNKRKCVISCKNIDDRCIVPQDGIYSDRLEIKDGIFYLHEQQMRSPFEQIRLNCDEL
ncbi:MAG: FAD synthetase family protein [Erysipelotrichaceae bacterium]|nr:FAD synthetase family protein [Erysipelotrichaceae bacterium]